MTSYTTKQVKALLAEIEADDSRTGDSESLYLDELVASLCVELLDARKFLGSTRSDLVDERLQAAENARYCAGLQARIDKACRALGNHAEAEEVLRILAESVE